MKQHLEELVQRFHNLLGISKNDINTEHMTEIELCEELGKCIGDIKDEFTKTYPIMNRAFMYKTFLHGYECMICKKCFINKDAIEMHFRFEHRK